jgi:multidrug efflux pump subunit AcrB
MKSLRSIVANLAEHPTAANLLMLLFLLLGLFSLGDIRRETFPDFASTEVSVTAAYPGATAEDVESAICQRIEEAVEGISGIARVTSRAAEGRATVILEMEDGSDLSEFLGDIKTEVEAITEFPEEVEDVIVRRLNRVDQVFSVAVVGPMTEPHLKLYAEQLRAELRRLPLVSQVDLLGFSEHQILVEVPAHQLVRLGLTLAQMQSIIEQQSLDLPAGTIETTGRDFLIRLVEERRTVKEIAELVVLSGEGGREIRLGEIARITDRFADEEDAIYLNGKRAALLQINKNKTEDALEVMAEVERYFAAKEQLAPPGVEFIVTQNISKIVRDRLSMLTRNGLEGLFLVFLTLWLFFSFRMSFWVTMGLPVSFFLSFFLMKQIGFSFNMLSMVGLLIAVGILMDDAIVIVENVAAELEQGKKALEATIDGVCGVAGGVWSSFFTTLFVFGALALSMQGDIGKVLYAIPVVLILTISVSMIEAFGILPNHLAHSLHSHHSAAKPRFRRGFDTSIEWLREKVVGTTVDRVIRHRYLFVGGIFGFFLFSLGMIAGGQLKVTAFPETEGDVLQARLLMPQGTPMAETQRAVARLLTAIEQINAELTPLQPGGRELVQNSSVLFNLNADAGESGPHVATVSLDLLSAEERETSLPEIVRRWRETVGGIPDAISLAYKEPSVGPGGRPIEMQLQGEDLEQLKRASTALIDHLGGYRGVFDLSDDLRPGKPEFLIRLNPGALAMGFTARDLGLQLRAAFHGAKAGEIQHRDESYELWLRLSGEDRRLLTDLSSFTLISPAGERVPLQSIASIAQGRGFATINRVDAVRTVTVIGDVDTALANAAEIIADTRAAFVPRLKEEFGGVELVLEGEEKERTTAMQGMAQAFFIGIFGVFLILSFQFRSYVEPFAVMAIIPLTLIGVIWGHLAMGLDLTMPSIMGYISLAGVVVNDSILLVSFIRNNIDQGMAVQEAARYASRARFRAVLLTSMTTVMGLLPLLSERSMQAQILIPLASSIVFGLITATFLVLLLVPAIYSIFDDFGLTRNN